MVIYSVGGKGLRDSGIWRGFKVQVFYLSIAPLSHISTVCSTMSYKSLTEPFQRLWINELMTKMTVSCDRKGSVNFVQIPITQVP